RVPTETIPFPATNGARRAGVSSFGFSGTNAHVIVEEPPTPAPAAVIERPRLLALSAADPSALREHVAQIAFHLERSGAEFSDICHTANTGRAHLAHRVAVRADDAGEAGIALAAWLADVEPACFLRAGVVPGGEIAAPAFLFTGQGAQYPGMAW